MRRVQSLYGKIQPEAPYLTYRNPFKAGSVYTCHSDPKITLMSAFWKMRELGSSFTADSAAKIVLATEDASIPSSVKFTPTVHSSAVWGPEKLPVDLYSKLSEISDAIFDTGRGDRDLVTYLLAEAMGEQVLP